MFYSNNSISDIKPIDFVKNFPRLIYYQTIIIS